MKIRLSNVYGGSGNIHLGYEAEIPDELFGLTRRDALALAAPEPPESTMRDHDNTERQKAKDDDRYQMKAFCAMEWKYRWADKMIAASGVE